MPEEPKIPVWGGYTFKKSRELLFNFFGFRNLPEEENTYYEALKKLLTVIPQDQPCIIAGDTNVCIQPQGANSKGFTAEECLARKKDLQENILPAHRLVLIDCELDNQFTWFNRKGAYSDFRCDLLIVSESLQSRIKNLCTGTPQEFVENSGSDHLPIFFSCED